MEYHPLCLWDYVAVSEGVCPAGFKSRYCGSIHQISEQILLNSSDACLKFVSDFIIPKRGFMLLVTSSGRALPFVCRVIFHVLLSSANCLTLKAPPTFFAADENFKFDCFFKNNK